MACSQAVALTVSIHVSAFAYSSVAHTTGHGHIFDHMPEPFLLGVHLIAFKSFTQSLISLASLASIGR
jgi:hypothetical protein